MCVLGIGAIIDLLFIYKFLIEALVDYRNIGLTVQRSIKQYYIFFFRKPCIKILVQCNLSFLISCHKTIFFLPNRRVLWLTEQWISVKPPSECRNVLYDFIISSLGPTLDIAVRLAAASALRTVLDDFEFNAGKLYNMLQPLIYHSFGVCKKLYDV